MTEMTLQEAIAEMMLADKKSRLVSASATKAVELAVMSGDLIPKADIERGLADPTVVYYSMVHGTIAKPSLAHIVHVYAEHQLIPKADADQAVALAYQRAGDLANTTFSGSGTDAAAIIRMSILALADQDALAEVQALRAKLKEAQMQSLADLGQAQDAWGAQKAAEADVAKLREALIDHNDLLRSAMQIAKREGVEGEIGSTNWDAYYNRVAVVLKRHHETANTARGAP